VCRIPTTITPWSALPSVGSDLSPSPLQWDEKWIDLALSASRCRAGTSSAGMMWSYRKPSKLTPQFSFPPQPGLHQPLPRCGPSSSAVINNSMVSASKEQYTLPAADHSPFRLIRPTREGHYATRLLRCCRQGGHAKGTSSACACSPRATWNLASTVAMALVIVGDCSCWFDLGRQGGLT
jgi:hypothetical protein